MRALPLFSAIPTTRPERSPQSWESELCDQGNRTVCIIVNCKSGKRSGECPKHDSISVCQELGLPQQCGWVGRPHTVDRGTMFWKVRLCGQWSCWCSFWWSWFYILQDSAEDGVALCVWPWCCIPWRMSFHAVPWFASLSCCYLRHLGYHTPGWSLEVLRVLCFQSSCHTPKWSDWTSLQRVVEQVMPSMLGVELNKVSVAKVWASLQWLSWGKRAFRCCLIGNCIRILPTSCVVVLKVFLMVSRGIHPSHSWNVLLSGGFLEPLVRPIFKACFVSSSLVMVAALIVSSDVP